MRPKVIIAVLLAGLAGLAVIFYLKPAASRPETAVTPVAEPAATPPKAAAAVPQLKPATNIAAVATASQPKKPASVATSDAADEAAAKIQAQIDRLVDLQSNDDDASLQAILKELTNTNRIIRHEAIEATIQFGGHTAVPVLKDLATRTWDPDEKKELLEAAEFLALPTLSEARAQKEQEKMQDPVPPQ
ncbi:MAG TPA: hypothetical protein VNN22_12165 [Verrucomicrobiae bacterium]|nr:hypothetical protein [Verrucomicrobiae bacterium]